MRSKRRALVVTGVMLSALVLFGPAAAFAQTDTAPANGVTAVTATALAHDRILVQWTAVADAGTEAVARKEFELGYIQHDTATSFGAASLTTMKVATQSRQYEITGLSAEKRYLIGVRAIAGAAADPTANTPINQDYAVGTNIANATTDEAPVPETILERDIMVTEGDMELDVEWEAPRPDSDSRTSTLTITEYQVAFDEKADGSTHKVWPATITSPIVNIDR